MSETKENRRELISLGGAIGWLTAIAISAVLVFWVGSCFKEKTPTVEEVHRARAAANPCEVWQRKFAVINHRDIKALRIRDNQTWIIQLNPYEETDFIQVGRHVTIPAAEVEMQFPNGEVIRDRPGINFTRPSDRFRLKNLARANCVLVKPVQ